MPLFSKWKCNLLNHFAKGPSTRLRIGLKRTNNNGFSNECIFNIRSERASRVWTIHGIHGFMDYGMDL